VFGSISIRKNGLRRLNIQSKIELDSASTLQVRPLARSPSLATKMNLLVGNGGKYG
jgi:hypothetical protein